MSNDPIHALVNNFKLATILTPLLEAVEINKRTEGIQGLNASDMFKDVIKTGVEIYQQVIRDKGEQHYSDQLPDMLFILLSLALRNTAVLYNSASLDTIKDDIVMLLKENSDFIKRFQQNSTSISHDKNKDAALDAAACSAMSSLSTMFIPVWLFHSNIFTAGLINLDKMNDLNARVCFFLKTSIEELIDVAGSKCSPTLRTYIFFLCAESAAKVLVDYQIKILKSKALVLQYIENPESVIVNILPVMQSAWVTLNELTQQSMKKLTEKGG